MPQYRTIRTGYFGAQKLGTDRWAIVFYRPRQADMIILADNLDQQLAFDFKDDLKELFEEVGEEGWTREPTQYETRP